ncbi:MAG: sugar ABC transporter substrate-binding protein [Oscillospiraceae bacterium]|nr:sugar ABC transporter substrate-binding protein [Oscillospiraceae bacterium]
MKKVLAMVLVLCLCGSVLAGCGQTAAPASDAASAPAEQAKETGTVNILCVSTAIADIIAQQVKDFEAETGIHVNCEVLEESSAFEKLLTDLSSGSGTYDLFMTSPVYNWQYIAGGWVEPLDAYIADPEKTEAEWDLDDFIPGILNAGRWTGEKLGGVGEGNLYCLPLMFETYMLGYRPSVLAKYNMAVPTTYEELADCVSRLAAEPGLSDDNGMPMYPVVTRFDKYWDLTYLTFGTMLQSYGVTMVDENGNVAVNSPASIEATEIFVKMIQEGSPDGAGQFTFYEAEQGFASGQYVFSFNEADGFTAVYEDPEQSMISDDVGYAVTPLGPDGTRSASTWVWSMSMNSASRHKDEAWQVLKYLTSKDTMIKQHLLGSMEPVRQSAWEDEGVIALINGYGEYEGQYLEVVKTMGDCAELTLPAHPEITRALDVWATAVQSAYYGQSSVEDALNAAAAEIADILAN